MSISRNGVLYSAASLVLLGFSPDAWAFTVGTGFTDACHERFTMATYFQTRVALPVDLIPEPNNGPWESFVEELFEDLGYPSVERKEKFYFASLMAGVRSNDTDGHSSLNLNALRSLHVHPERQYDHFLRAQGDDFLDGNRVAIVASRQQMLFFYDHVNEYLKKKPSDQIIRVTVTVDFHGEIEVDAWAVAYYLGKALHTMQDSFSHCIRSDDMSKIIHVLNYAEAVSGNWDEERDGLRHSESMDECNQEMGPVLDGVLQACVDLVFASKAVIEGEDQGLETVLAVMDKWLTYEPGCDMSNDYCGSQWAKRAKDNPTLPYVEALFGCGTIGEWNTNPVSFLLMFLLVVAMVARRRW